MRLAILLAGLAPLATGCAADVRPAAPTAIAAPAQVEVVRDGQDWTAVYRFSRPAGAWAFHRSATAADTNRSWRLGTWMVETPGVRLERRGAYDILAASGSVVPSEVRIRFRPFSGNMNSSYDPALVFTDGTVALFDGQFDLFPVDSAEAAGNLPRDTNAVPEADSATRTTFRDARGRVLHAGRRQSSVSLEDAGSYVLFGPARPIVTDAMATIIDPALPAWLQRFPSQATPDILARYAASLGPAPGSKPTIIVSWAGPTPRVISMGGSTLANLIIMRFEGEGVLRERAELRNHARWFIAHEAAHFWLGQAVRYERSRDAWITEGGAELLAIRMVQSLDPSFDWRQEVNQRIGECARLSNGRGVSSGEERNEHRAYYACGTVFALVAEASSRQPFSAFVRNLVEANRADQVVTRAEWLQALDRNAGDGTLRADIESMLDRGSAAPGPAIASLFRRVGIDHVVGSDGVPTVR